MRIGIRHHSGYLFTVVLALALVFGFTAFASQAGAEETGQPRFTLASQDDAALGTQDAVTTFADFKQKLEAGTSVTLDDDLSVPSDAGWITVGSGEATLDLNGHTRDMMINCN